MNDHETVAAVLSDELCRFYGRRFEGALTPEWLGDRLATIALRALGMDPDE